MNTRPLTDSLRYPLPATPAVSAGALPDPFARTDGSRVATPAEWPAQAAYWRSLVAGIGYGGLPPAPSGVTVEPLCAAGVGRWPEAPRLLSYRVHVHGGERPFSFALRLLLPAGDGPFPVVLNGDGCWWYVTEEIARSVVRSGCALATFDRTEFAEDRPPADDQASPRRSGGLYDVYPGTGFGSIAAWAWGYHRAVDALEAMARSGGEPLDESRIAVTGHSRGGKTVLLAGATDERIALVNDNAGGAMGSSVFRFVGDGGETLGILDHFPSWFGPGPGLRPYLGREAEAPYDQHCLLAAVAPRPLLLTYALDDRWSNPEGMVLSSSAADEVYRFLGAQGRLAFHLRPGTHSHAAEDWAVLLDFIGAEWFARERTAPYGVHPYEHLSPAFAWRAPQ